MSALAPVKDIIADIKAGRMVILVDEEDRENEGDVVLAAEFVTPEAINFMVKHCRGLVCLTLTEERCAQLGLKQMVRDNRTPHGTAFTASIEAATGVTTGISAHDRARTIQVAVARNAKPEDIVMPGHIFPLQAQKGGVLIRAGHTEAGCDFTLHGFEDTTTGEIHLALVKGDITPDTETLVRVHEPISVLDFLDADSDRHSFSIDRAMQRINEAGSGVIVMLRRTETDASLRTLLTDPTSAPAVRWDARTFGVGAQILRSLNVRKMRLLASPRNIPSMAGFDLELTGYLQD